MTLAVTPGLFGAGIDRRGDAGQRVVGRVDGDRGRRAADRDGQRAGADRR